MAGIYEINPLQITKWGHFKDLNGPLQKILEMAPFGDFQRVYFIIFSDISSTGTLVFFARDHLESLKCPHLVILNLKGWFHNGPPFRGQKIMTL